MLVRLEHGQWVNTDHIKSVQEMNGRYEVYVSSPKWVPLIATPNQFAKIVEALNGNPD